MSEYSAANIEVLEGLEPIRRRPGMYVGSVDDGSALHHLLWELVANSVDEHLAGRCRSIDVTLHDGGAATVEDDGGGIPVEQERRGVSVLELVLTQLHPGATYDGHSPHVHLGLHGVGVVAVNALSESLVAEVFRQGKHYRQAYRRGRPEGPVEVVGETDRQGTRITFSPDPTIFKAPEFDASLVSDRLRELAFLFAGLACRFVDERKQRFHYEGGLGNYVERLSRPGRPLHKPVVCRGGQGPLKIEAALQWAEGASASILGFVNGLRTVAGGTHIKGLSWALAGMFFEQTKAERPRDRRRIAEAMEQGLSAVVHVHLHDPKFGSPTRAELKNPEIALAVTEIVADGLRRFCREQPEIAAAIVEAARHRLT